MMSLMFGSGGLELPTVQEEPVESIEVQEEPAESIEVRPPSILML